MKKFIIKTMALFLLVIVVSGCATTLPAFHNYGIQYLNEFSAKIEGKYRMAIEKEIPTEAEVRNFAEPKAGEEAEKACGSVNKIPILLSVRIEETPVYKVDRYGEVEEYYNGHAYTFLYSCTDKPIEEIAAEEIDEESIEEVTDEITAEEVVEEVEEENTGEEVVPEEITAEENSELPVDNGANSP